MMGALNMADTLVKLDDVSLSFGMGSNLVHAVQNVYCTIVAGEHIALVGPSGSGKSSLLALIGGLDQPSTGQITWPLWGSASLRPRHIGMAFQSSSLLPSLTVLENVEIPLLMLGETAKSSTRALEALHLLSLEKLADRLPAELSGGQMQRVAFARALVTKPALVLADEPTGQLDQATGAFVMSQVIAAIQNTQATLIVATHDSALATSFPKQWKMSFGKLVEPQPKKDRVHA
jgi:ABC-type lipoprotein export system ATPase subunit